MNARKRKWIEKKKAKSGKFYHETVEAEISGQSLKHGIYYHHDRNKKEKEMISSQHPSKVSDDDTQFVLRRYRDKNADLPLPVPPNYDQRRNYGAERKSTIVPGSGAAQAGGVAGIVAPAMNAMSTYDNLSPYDAYSYPQTRDELFLMQMQMQQESPMYQMQQDMAMQYRQRMNRGTMDDSGVWHPYNNGINDPYNQSNNINNQNNNIIPNGVNNNDLDDDGNINKDGNKDGDNNSNIADRDNNSDNNSNKNGDSSAKKRQKSMSPGKRVNRIQTQLEYYFSVDNMDRDEYLRSLMDSRGWVSVSKIVEFNRMKHLGADKEMVIEAAFHSQILEVSVKDRQCIRMHKYWKRYRKSNKNSSRTKSSKNENSSRSVEKKLDASDLNKDTIAQIVKLIEKKAEKRKKRREDREKRKKRKEKEKEKEKEKAKEKEENQDSKDNQENKNEDENDKKEKSDESQNIINDEEDTKMEKNEEETTTTTTNANSSNKNNKKNEDEDQDMVDID